MASLETTLRRVYWVIIARWDRSTTQSLILSLSFDRREGNFEQFARVDAPILSWEFYLQNGQNENIASIRRDFAGFGREIFTDTGEYLSQRVQTA